MPYTTENVPAELYLEHKGVKIYHVYRNNNFEDGVREYWFDTVEDSDDDGDTCFDVRDLSKSNPEGTYKGPCAFDDWRKAVIIKAIDDGLIVAALK